MQKDYQIGSLIMQSQKELAAKHFIIRGKIGLIRESDGKELATYDVVFPIYLTGFRHLASEKFNTKVVFSLISVNMSELSKLSVYEVNRIASNVNRLSLRVNACLSENAFRQLLSIRQCGRTPELVSGDEPHLLIGKFASLWYNKIIK